MTIDVRRKGSNWERELAEILEKNLGGKFKRIPGSGAVGTIMNYAVLTGDVMGELPYFPQKIKVEAKVGYGGSAQMTLKKEWFDKVKAEAANDYSFPILCGKFSGAREGVKTFVAMDLETFAKLFAHIRKQQELLDVEAV